MDFSTPERKSKCHLISYHIDRVSDNLVKTSDIHWIKSTTTIYVEEKKVTIGGKSDLKYRQLVLKGYL